MTNRKLLGIGVVGSVLAVICCFTPILVILLGAVGLSAWIGGLDYVLLPALLLFVGVTVFAFLRNCKGSSATCCTPTNTPIEGGHNE